MADDAKKDQPPKGKVPPNRPAADVPKLTPEQQSVLRDWLAVGPISHTVVNRTLPNFEGFTSASSSYIPGTLGIGLGRLQSLKSEREIELEKKTTDLTAELNAIRTQL